MKLSNFEKIIKSCKKTNTHTGTTATKLKVMVNPERTHYRMVATQNCGSKLRKNLTLTSSVVVELKEPIAHLTVFQVATLYMVMAEQKLPVDYANYHKTIAGKRFINNIRALAFHVKLNNPDEVKYEL